jgi:antitoxin ParD1/3/4
MNISLTPHLEELVKAKVESGLYNSASEVMRDALRLLEERDRLREIELEEYRAKIREGMESGEGIPAEKVFSRLEAKYKAMIEQQG